MADKSTVNSVIDRMLRVGNKTISLFSGLMAAFLILYSSYVLYDSFYVQTQAFSSAWDLAKFKPEIIDDSMILLSGDEDLKNINEDYRAWVTLYDTNIDYPVLQGDDDLYYANHDIYGKSSMTGSVYLATGSTGDFTDTYSLLYGHHMDNDAMFGGLDHFKERDYFNSHREGILITEDKVYDLRIFAVLTTNAYENMIYEVGPNKSMDWLQFVRNNASIFDGSALEGANKYLAMSTCAGGATSSRLVVFATMTERDMTPYPPEEETVTPPEKPTPSPEITEPGRQREPVRQTSAIGEAIGRIFTPKGNTYGDACWALFNLILTIITIYLWIPFLHLRAKYGRGRMMDLINRQTEKLRECDDLTDEEKEKVANIETYAKIMRDDKNNDSDLSEEEIRNAVEYLYYRVDDFRGRFHIGIPLEGILAVTALILFIKTEDISRPMVLIDKWTVVHILLLMITWFVDLRLIRYREENAKIPEKQETMQR